MFIGCILLRLIALGQRELAFTLEGTSLVQKSLEVSTERVGYYNTKDEEQELMPFLHIDWQVLYIPSAGRSTCGREVM